MTTIQSLIFFLRKVCTTSYLLLKPTFGSRINIHPLHQHPQAQALQLIKRGSSLPIPTYNACGGSYGVGRSSRIPVRIFMFSLATEDRALEDGQLHVTSSELKVSIRSAEKLVDMVLYQFEGR